MIAMTVTVSAPALSNDNKSHKNIHRVILISWDGFQLPDRIFILSTLALKEMHNVIHHVSLAIARGVDIDLFMNCSIREYGLHLSL